MNGKKHRQTKATDISPFVAAAVAKRDCAGGLPASCIICGRPGIPYCHIVRRSQGGLGVEANIVSLCNECHYAFDEGIGLKRLAPLGIKSQSDVKAFIVAYISQYYPGWNEEMVKYHKEDGYDTV